MDKGVAQHLATLHNSSLIQQFFVRYPSVLPYWTGTPFEPPSIPLTRWDYPVPDPVLLISSDGIKSNSHAERSKGKRGIADTDAPTDKHREFAKTIGVDLGPEWGKFKNYCLANDRRYANFEAAFRNWLARAAEMKGERRVL